VWKECHFRKKSAKPIFFIETKTSFLTKKSQTSQKIGDSNPENENPIEKPQVRSPLALDDRSSRSRKSLDSKYEEGDRSVTVGFVGFGMVWYVEKLLG